MDSTYLREFRAYLRQCTDRQVQGVYDKEYAAARHDYAELAIAEADCRGLVLRTDGPDDTDRNGH